MSYIVVDVESDGPSPYRNSMVCFGAVIVDGDLNKTFYGQTAPVSKLYEPEALAISGFSRVEHENFEHPSVAIRKFRVWIQDNSIGNPIFISDNPVFDFKWIDYYMHRYQGMNPFGYSARRIGDLYCGLTKNLKGNREWKKLRKTKHDHNPTSDALGNAEALLEIGKKFNLKFY